MIKIKKQFNNNSLPEVLQKYPWVVQMSGSSAILVLYDEEGQPLWVHNRQGHRWNLLVETLLTAPIRSFYHLPGYQGLSSALASDARLPENLRHNCDHLKWIADSGEDPLSLFPVYASKSGFECASICPFFTTDWPLTLLQLMRLSETRYLGIVRLRTIHKHILNNENRNILMTDGTGCIRGYSALFAEPLKKGMIPTPLLRVTLNSILRFSRLPIPIQKPFSENRLRQIIEWQAGKKRSPFRLYDSTRNRLIQENSELLLENRDIAEYSYLEWEEPFPADLPSWEIRIGFTSLGSKLPNLIIRGLSYNPSRSPDILGYSLTNSEGEHIARFRKSGVGVRTALLPDIETGEPHELSLRKTGNIFQILLDEKSLESWVETSPFLLPSEDRLYLFLRPGESLRLRYLRACVAEAVFVPVPEPLTASYADGDIPVRYHVAMEQGVIGNENFTLYQFNDITPIMDNLARLTREQERLRGLFGGENPFLCHSPSAKRLLADALRVAESRLSVIIEGETGSGKEVLARAIHRASLRRDASFVRIDCAAMPVSLMESELFGHEKGAFTGAVGQRKGLFEQAQGGTVFLDEVGNLSREVQAKLLGVLESGEIQRLGSQKPVKVDFRLIAAANIPFATLAGEGRLREDLFHRINQIRLTVPPLRERSEDIKPLADVFLKEANQEYDRAIEGFDRGALAFMLHHTWPGNVRELRHSVMRAAVLTEGNWIKVQDLGLEKTTIPHNPEEKIPRRHRPSRDTVERVLSETGGNMAHAAEKLSMSRCKLYRLVTSFEICLNDFRNLIR